MKEIIQPFLDLIQKLVQPEQGTKFLVSLAGIGSIFYLQYKQMGDWQTSATIAAVAIAYFIGDIYYKTKKG